MQDPLSNMASGTFSFFGCVSLFASLASSSLTLDVWHSDMASGVFDDPGVVAIGYRLAPFHPFPALRSTISVSTVIMYLLFPLRLGWRRSARRARLTPATFRRRARILLFAVRLYGARSCHRVLSELIRNGNGLAVNLRLPWRPQWKLWGSRGAEMKAGPSLQGSSWLSISC